MELLFQVVSGSLQVATVVFLGWLYRRTSLTPVLFNLLWQVVTSVLGWLHPWSHVAPTYFIAWSTGSRIISTALFVWMILSLVRWGRPDFSSSRNPASPGAAA